MTYSSCRLYSSGHLRRGWVASQLGVQLAPGADLAILQHPTWEDSSTHHHLPAALQPARMLKYYVPLLERSCFVCLELSVCNAAPACNQSSSTALRHVSGDQLCHFFLEHVVEVPLRLLQVPAD